MEGDHDGAKQQYVAGLLECPYLFDMLHESSLVNSNKAAAWLTKVQGTEQGCNSIDILGTSPSLS